MSGHYRNVGTRKAVKVIQVTQKHYSLCENNKCTYASADDLAWMIDSGLFIKESHL